MKLSQFFCRHTYVRVTRAHPDSPKGKANTGKEAWIDLHGVYNLVECCKCGKILQAIVTEHIYGDLSSAEQ